VVSVKHGSTAEISNALSPDTAYGHYPGVALPDRACARPWPGTGHSASREQHGTLRVVVTRIDQDGTMQRRAVDTAYSGERREWEDLIARALAIPPPYQPSPGSPLYHISVGGQIVLVAEHDLSGPLLELVTAVMALGDQVLDRTGEVPSARVRFNASRLCRGRSISGITSHRISAVIF
jgi:hypothetical protein